MKRMPKPSTMSEQKTREKIMIQAIKLGCGLEVAGLFKKYDDLLKTCTNDSEREHIKVLAITDIYKFIGFSGGLTIDNQVVIPDDKS